jgi:lipopolysaccharide transport system ATP-binding protein
MEDVSKNEGRTVLFVSHNMAAVRSLCNRGIVLKSGSVHFDGSQTQAIDFYQNMSEVTSLLAFRASSDSEFGNENIQVVEFLIKPLSGNSIDVSTGFCFELKFRNSKKGINLDATFELSTLDDTVVFHHGALVTTNSDSKAGIYSVKGSLLPYTLNCGIYKFKVIFGENQRIPLYTAEDIVRFEVYNESLGSNSNLLPGILRPRINYEIQFDN